MEHEDDIHHAATEAAHAVEALPLFEDPSFWASIGLFLFLALLVWRNVPGLVTKSLDDRAEKIKSELHNAKALREEAEAKLADAKKRQAAAEADAKEIVAAAQREAEALAESAAASLKESIDRRQKLAEERIARAEAEALRDVKLAAIETASKAAEQVLTKAMAGKSGEDHFAQSLEAVKKALQ